LAEVIRDLLLVVVETHSPSVYQVSHWIAALTVLLRNFIVSVTIYLLVSTVVHSAVSVLFLKIFIHQCVIVYTIC